MGKSLDTVSVWKTIKQLNSGTTQQRTVPELKDGGEIAKSAEEKLNMLAERFFPNVDDTWVDDCESSTYVTLHEINIALKAMLPLSAPGHDGFPAIVFKEAPVRLRKVIQKLAQRCFEVSHFSKILKVERPSP
jgi:hypothetical protein